MTAAETLEGWFALHDLRRLDQAAWVRLDQSHRDKAIEELSDLLAGAEAGSGPDTGLSLTYQVIGHKADLLTLHLRPEVSQLQELERNLDRTAFGVSSTKPYSYFSVIEVSRHAAPEGTAENVEGSPYIQARLFPTLPEHSRYVCFYPMSKRRGEADNWYLLDRGERADLMRDHGRTGRKYAGKVSQIVTGSIGLDDWEWGVTLFADDPLQFKKLVYEMRFDDVSARFAEFGHFYVGQRLLAQDLAKWLR